MTKIIIVGGGAAGIMAAIAAREKGAQVTLLEKNSILGKKLMITGKGRCNITNAGTVEQIIKNIPGNGSFLYGSLHQFSNQDVISLFHRLGVPTKVERGARVFPQSDKALDVVEALSQYLTKVGVDVHYGKKVTSLIIAEGRVSGVRLEQDKSIFGDMIILATGGASYPGTGSTGDGYRMAKAVGHQITPLRPTLVPLETMESWVKELQGLSLRNVQVEALVGDKLLDSAFGEMLFTHFGVSGPVILSLSRAIVPYLSIVEWPKVKINIDLKPALSENQLDLRIQRDFKKFSRKFLVNAFSELLPRSLIPVFIKNLSIPSNKPVNQITKEERGEILDLFKNFSLTITKPRPLAEAIVTAGGVNLKEVNPKTMASKIVQGLYLAGEVLDIDGFTGGYNLQGAFSTGYVAGSWAAE